MFNGIDDRELDEIQYSPTCVGCKHIKNFGIDHSCKAFRRIPDEIWEGRNKHRKPYPGDHGIRFEPVGEGSKSKI